MPVPPVPSGVARQRMILAMSHKDPFAKQGRPTAHSDLELREFVEAIVAGDMALVSQLLAESPALARASFQEGASRQTAKKYYLDKIGRYILAGDTALHVAAAAYSTEIARK